MSHETVGSLLAIIANSINNALRTLMFADKRAWGPDEYEQLRLLEGTLDEAKKDFQELPMLVNGRFYYENDRKIESLEDLRLLCTQFELHSQTFKDWSRTGGPINALWANDTLALRRDLHRAQCRAARRIYNEAATMADTAQKRCLGAQLVLRAQRHPENPQQRSLEEIATCNSIGKFERFGKGEGSLRGVGTDIAFVCDFCDGHLVWPDLREMPTTRIPPADGGAEPSSASSTAPATSDVWAATGFARSDGIEKNIVFAPVAIANHLPLEPGEWLARILCPFCDEYFYEEQGDDDMERVRYTQDEHGFEDVEHFREHLEWNHATLVPTPSKCSMM
ncbi:hypothetical protein F5Y15DRAFT_331984 [Xylariaceae sp. FL0016]|nr:hypothetical protein F5Y15DRAFT_331984 [Xylariaceae sp. FL0016]